MRAHTESADLDSPSLTLLRLRATVAGVPLVGPCLGRQAQNGLPTSGKRVLR